MRHERLAEYLAEVERAVAGLRHGYVEHYREELLTPCRANLRIWIRFANGRLLEVSEAVVVEGGALVPLSYRYHCQDAGNRLLFRYDNTPHFPELSSFPHHKHLPDRTVAAGRPSLFDVLKECGELPG